MEPIRIPGHSRTLAPVWSQHCSGKVPVVAAGPVTLILGPGFGGVKPPPVPRAARPAHGKPGNRAGGSGGSGGFGSPTFVQTRNAGASICSGLPAANRNSGSPP
jgi:hypothetical protein